MTSSLLVQLGVPVLTRILAQVLGEVQHPAARTASEALSSLEDALIAGQISTEQVVEANRHAEYMAQLESDQDTQTLANTQKTLRQELASDDKFVRRMRPTFGYLMALTWTAQMLGLAYVMVFHTGEAHLVLEAVESLSMIWTVGLSVLGIYVYKRSEDKKMFSQIINPALNDKKSLVDKLLDHPEKVYADKDRTRTSSLNS